MRRTRIEAAEKPPFLRLCSALQPQRYPYYNAGDRLLQAGAARFFGRKASKSKKCEQMFIIFCEFSQYNYFFIKYVLKKLAFRATMC
jgi:hypothetical protein